MAEDESEEHEWHIRLKQDEEMEFFTELALHEAERWIQAVTRKKFQHPDDFRGSLGNGVLLCELLNNLQAGSVKRINKLPGAISGLDNINVFLSSCQKNFGLTPTQLFDPGDLEDLSQRAIADESEYLLKQEVDRRARNVAITIYWLGRQVEGTFKGPSLDFSAFSALVHHQGNKNIISNECIKNENWKNTQAVRQNSKDAKRSSHARDSSYDSLGSYEKESESSFDDLDNSENMPVREFRRYGSQSSLGKNENANYSLANDSAFSDRHDSVYQSSPELSQGSHAHTRSSSTDDSMDGSYYGNSHSRQSSSSTEGYATRMPAGGGRRTSTSMAATAAAAADPLQFVKIKGADELAKTATKQIEAAKETALMRPALRGDEGEPDWQSKLSGWKSRRKSASAAVYQRVGEVEGIFTEDEIPEKPKTKTFSQITAEKEKRKSLGNLRSFYPMEEDENFSAKLKEHDTLHIMKSEDEITQATEIKLKKKAKGEEVAPWARDSSGEGDSQSDSETNISHQSGDTDNVFAEQTVSKVVNRDESWVKRTSSGGSQTSPSVRHTPPPVGNKSIKDRNMQLWENSAKESQSKMDKTKVDIPANRSSNKIKNITKAFEEKESSAKAEPVIQRRSEYGRKSWSLDSTDSPFRRRSSDFSDKSDKLSPKGFNEKNVSPLLSPTSPKALLPKEQRPSPSNFKYTSDYSSNKPLEGSSRSQYLQKLSTPPAAPFGYRVKLTSSDKDLPLTGIKEQSHDLPQNGAKMGSNSGSFSGSKSPEIKSPVSDVFYGTQRKYAASAPALFRAAQDKDVKEIDTHQEKSKVEASNSSKDDCGLSVDASGVDSGNPESELENNGIGFYLPSDNGHGMHTETAEEPVENVDKTTEVVAESEQTVDSEKIYDQVQYDAEDEEDTKEQFETNSNAKNDKNDVVASDNERESNLIDFFVGDKIENIDNSNNLISKLISGNVAQPSEENDKNDFIDENMLQANMYQSNSKPNFFVFPSSVVSNGEEEFIQGPVKEGSPGNFSPEVHSLDSDEENMNAGMMDYHVSHSIVDDMMDFDNGFIAEFEKDSIVNLKSMTDNDIETHLIDLDSSREGSEQVELEPSVLPDTYTDEVQGKVLQQEPASQPPDLITSLPYLPLLTPYSSEGSGAERVSTTSTAERLNSATDEDVFYDDGSKAGNVGDEGVNETVADGKIEITLEEKKLVEKNIKISQAPNNSRGFGFFVTGGSDKREPVTVSKVSLGSSADISDVLMNDEVLSVNNHEVGNMTLKQVQGIIDHSVKRGQIELKIRRKPDEGSFDSLDEEGGGYLGGSNKMDTQSDSSSFSTDPLSDDASYKTPQSSARQTGSDDNEKPSLMDRLLAEKSREPNNNLDMSMYKSESKEDKPPSPVAVENLKAEISFSSHMTPSRRSPVTQQKTKVPVSALSDPPLEQPVYASSRESPISQAKTEVSEGLKSEPPSAQTLQTERDMVAPIGDTVVEERQTITMKPSPVVQDEPPPVAAVRRRRTPEKQREEPKRETPPPAPPVGEAPPLPKSSDDESGGFGPPAALLRWQRPRAKSEHKVISPYTSVFDRQVDEAKRLSSTLPRRSEDSDKDIKEVSKDDSVLSRVTKDFESTVSVSKPPLTKSRTYHFDDVSKIQDWDQKQEEERQYEPRVGRTVTPPPAFEVEIHKEEKLTPQLKSTPGRKVGVPGVIDLPVTIPGKDDTPLSPQEKFERDQQRIRQQYEEEKRRAKEAEKQREQQDQKLIKKDSERLLHLESQIQPGKLDDIKPVHPPVQSNPPQFTSEPMTMKVPANSQGRQLVIDPRNQEESGDVPLPQYQFHVDLQKQEDKPKLRTLKQEPELSADELLERERERIREEEHRKFEEEKRRWKEEQDEQLRREQERLKAEREAIEREKAKLEQRHEPQSRYQPVTIHTSPRSSWAGSPSSHSPKSPPPALDPHHRGSSIPSRKADIWAPPSTQTHHKTSKSDIGAKERARLTREDLLAMNRKATPLQSMNKRFDEQENKEPEPVAREAPSKLELHMLNSVPKPKFRRAADWIKDEEEEVSAPADKYATAADKYADKQFVIGNKSDIIHKDYSTSQDHWVVQEAERRRLAESKDFSRRFDDSVHTAGPAKPSGSSLVNRFRGDIEPNKKHNRYSYPTPHDTDSNPPARPLSTSGSGLRHFERSASPELSSTQFSARNQSLNFANPSLSNTLPANFSFNANKAPKREPPAPAPKPKRSPTEQADQTHTVSGKQRCSHCEEELGFGAAMVIESLGLYYHVQCFRCCVCRAPLGSGSEGADVRVRVNKLHCRNCFSNDEAGLKFSKV